MRCSRVSEKQPAERNGSGQSGVTIDEDYVVDLIDADFVEADVVNDFAARGVFTDDDHFGGHHAARGIFVEAHQLLHFAGFAMFHFFQNFFGFAGLEASDQVSGFVRIHFLHDVGGAFGVEFFNDLRLEALIEFGDRLSGGFFVE